MSSLVIKSRCIISSVRCSSGSSAVAMAPLRWPRLQRSRATTTAVGNDAPTPASSSSAAQAPWDSNNTPSTSAASPSSTSPAPWEFLFDLRERETLWLEQNQARLVAIAAAYELGIPAPEAERALDALAALLPEVSLRIAKLRPQLVAPLIKDVDALPGRLIALRELLPGVDVGALVGTAPQLLLRTEADLRAAVARLKELLQLDDAGVRHLVSETWLFLEPDCVAEVVEQLAHLVPSSPPRELLLSDPSWLLRAQRGQRWLGEHPDSTMESMYWSND